MGKRKFNSKGRQVVETVQDDSETKQIKLDIETPDYGGNDAANALVLPSKKRDSKVKKSAADQTNVTRILSKRKRKLLEKIVDRKKKKEGRSGLLEQLATVQVAPDQLNKYTSIINVQTKGLKKHLLESRRDAIGRPVLDKSAPRINTVKGRHLLKGYAGNEADSDEDVSKPNYNVVGLEQSSSDNETDDEEADSEPVEPTKPELPLPSTENDSDTIKDEDDEKPPPAPVAPFTPTKPKLPIRPTKYVHVSRSKEIQAARIKLPILSEEQVIMEAINENLIVILAGETGSGKTTQVPQFLYEAGYAEDGKLIGITEPRRVAAISMAKRVAHEMNLSSDIVSYLIRFEGNVTNQTRIKFMTDGVLLKEIETDFVLSRYSVIILDEAHERSIYTDILVGLLSRIVLLRHKRGEPLKLIIMSATLRVEDFTKNTRLFKIPPPVLKVEARQFPVTIHFNKRTGTEYVKDAYKKALKIHNQLPEGGILIFLTGQQEVNFVVRKLRKAFPFKGRHELAAKKEPIKATFDDAGDSDDSCEMDMKKAISNARRSAKKRRAELVLPQISLDDYKLPTDDTEADLVDQESIDSDADEYNFGSDDDDDDDENVTGLKSTQPLWVLPLYSLLSSEKQAKVFEAPPANTRLCVVTTNVAETSLTIPNIKYVVDSGRQKARLYDKITGVSSFVVSFCSKAAANQRAGRAGRTAPGHCYRLYSSAVYNDEFEDFAVPDIQSKPVDHLMLQMKCMGIDKVFNFPFPSPPDLVQLQVAEQKLKLLGALEVATASSTNSTKSSEELTKVTALGQAIAAFPVSPRFGKMLALSHQHNLLQYTVCMVAALSVQEVLLETPASDPADSAALHQKSKWTHKRRAWAGTGNSLLLGDPMILLRAVGASEYAGSMGKLDEFCTENGLRPKAVAEIRKLRVQLTNDISLSMPDVVNLSVDPQMPPPSDVQAKLLRQILLAGMGDHIARRIPPEELNDKEDKIKFRYAYRCPDMVDPVFMHAASVLKKSQPDWVLYQEVYELQNGDSRKMFMRGVTAIEPEWLVTYVPSLCNVRAIKEEPLPPRLNQKDGRIYCYVDATFGRSGWEVPLAQIEMPFGELACRYFAMFFLSGEIVPGVLAHKKEFRSTPANILKSWVANQPHVMAFVNRLLRARVYSRQALLDAWAKDPNFLLAEFRDFLVRRDEDDEIAWPPV